MRGTRTRRLAIVALALALAHAPAPGRALEADAPLGVIEECVSKNLRGSSSMQSVELIRPSLDAVFLSLTGRRYSSGDEDGGTDLTYTFTRTGPNGSALTVNFGVSGAAEFTTDYNQALSERRKNTVLGGLIDGTIARGRMSSEAVGETQPLVDTGDGVREQGNRVAVVTLY